MELLNRLGLLGGTFDPPHCVHLQLAQAAQEQFNLDEVWLIPAGVPYHKSTLRSAAQEQRFEMCELLTKGNENWLKVCDVDIKRCGDTFTKDTIADLRRVLGNETKLFWICGSDTLSDVKNWPSSEYLASQLTFLVGERSCDNGGHCAGGRNGDDGGDSSGGSGGGAGGIDDKIIPRSLKVEWLKGDFPAISSFELRPSLRGDHELASEYISANVQEYITENGVY